MKDIRCLVGYHDYVKKQIEDSQYLQCRRCGKDKPSHVHQSPGVGWGGG